MRLTTDRCCKVVYRRCVGLGAGCRVIFLSGPVADGRSGPQSKLNILHNYPYFGTPNSPR